ncbi:MAG: hypothetical protein IPH18_12505 [Chitinophagaceae bacterium]|nr:hypothetical protein [Chitinophagaceae bacterium]
MVLTKDSFKCLEEISKLAMALKAENISLLPMRPEVRSKDVLDRMLTAAEFRQVIETMIEHKKKYKINFTTALPTIFYDEISKDKVFSKKKSCAAGREGTNLDFDPAKELLLVYGCSTCPASDINMPDEIKEPFLAGKFSFTAIEEFVRIWEDDEHWTIYRDDTIKSFECKTCEELGKRCTGSCPIQNIDWGAINLNADISSQIFAQIKNSTEWYCYKKLIS